MLAHKDKGVHAVVDTMLILQMLLFYAASQSEFVNGVFDNFLISLCEIFVDLCIEFSVG